MPEFYVTLARKIVKMPDFFLRILPEKNNKISEFCTIIARKIFSRFYFFGGGDVPVGSPSHTPMPVCIQNVFVARTVTHSALGGLVSCRDFIDVVVIERNDEFLATAGDII